MLGKSAYADELIKTKWKVGKIIQDGYESTDMKSL